MKENLEALCARLDLGPERVADVFRAVVGGDVSTAELAGFLIALRLKGETPDEVAGAARALLDAAQPFPRPTGLFADTAGTGGDGSGSINLSTAAGLVAAACGLPVVKHGNHSVSSRCGSADVLEACGARLDADAPTLRRALDDTGFTFLFAPAFQPGLRHAVPARQALGVRTIMNRLGPLVNPALNDGGSPRWLTLPTSAYAMKGNREQVVMLLPEQQAVIVRLGWSQRGYPINGNFTTIMNALP